MGGRKLIYLLVGFLSAWSCSQNSSTTAVVKPRLTCSWHGNCSSKAPEGAYDCSGNTIVKCVAGNWETVITCSSLHDSKGYACTCKGGCGTATVECSYAFNICGNQTYQTCPGNICMTSSCEDDLISLAGNE